MHMQADEVTDVVFVDKVVRFFAGNYLYMGYYRSKGCYLNLRDIYIHAENKLYFKEAIIVESDSEPLQFFISIKLPPKSDFGKIWVSQQKTTVKELRVKT